MADHRSHPRRPAMLSPDAADAIVGDVDPAEGAALAHTSAWALLGVGDEEFGPEAVTRLRATITDEGVDVVSYMWSRSPEFTLPGALWRLWLLSEWHRRDTALVDRRFAEGVAALQGSGQEGPLTCDPPALVIGEVDALLRGERTEDDLERVIASAARIMRVLAAGETHGAAWILDPADPLAHPVTTRAKALLRTAEELDRAAVLAASGTLD
ncbi:hypothetical protein I6B53_09930 [Schaalia sp. 19OD2882]|uniref:hypothetical protein n=1 Tax=Schaalia sp. 19OD2882 TaxID=2794089 RepID=UPI001C1EAEB8|nr:hypothetical protein [Schaalia sp. 19OD2882]QWW19392.1 hypothetical protein I6B53_09930 [Schaalia sp. 19OD2882]